MQVENFCSGLTAVALVMAGTVSGMAQTTVSNPGQYVIANVKPEYDEGTYTSYAAYADDKTLYVHVTIKDSLQKIKVLQNGMEVWIDVKGKKNKENGIMFPLGEKVNINPGGGNRNAAGGPPPFFFDRMNGGRNADSAAQALLIAKTHAMVKGLGGAAPDTVPVTMLNGVAVSLKLVNDTLVYDAAIQLASLPKQVAAKGYISIGIVEKGAQLPGFGGPMDGPGGDDMGGGGPPPGGDGGMMGPPPGREGGEFDMKRIFMADTIWYKIKLHNQ